MSKIRIQKVGAGNVISVSENGQPAFEIEVRDVRAAQSQPEGGDK